MQSTHDSTFTNKDAIKPERLASKQSQQNERKKKKKKKKKKIQLSESQSRKTRNHKVHLDSRIGSKLSHERSAFCDARGLKSFSFHSLKGVMQSSDVNAMKKGMSEEHHLFAGTSF
jgi:hypothetical protein